MWSLRKLLPVLGSIGLLIVAMLRLAGMMTEADQLDATLKALGIPAAIGPVEMAMMAPLVWGVAQWIRKRWRASRGLPPTQLPDPVLRSETDMAAFIRRYEILLGQGVHWDEARRRALLAILATRKL